MKTKITALALAAAAALSLAPKPAMAGDKEVAIIGGFLGGLLIASAINDSQHQEAYPCYHTDVIVNDRDDRRDESRDCGYWSEVALNVWVPGVWIEERSRHGQCHQRYVAGHYERRNNRTWVAYERHDRREHRDHDDRANSYGHRHDDRR